MSSAITVHALNWLSPQRTCCDLQTDGRNLAEAPAEVSCNKCALRLLRTGQAKGLDVSKIMDWTFEDLRGGESDG